MNLNLKLAGGVLLAFFLMFTFLTRTGQNFFIDVPLYCALEDSTVCDYFIESAKRQFHEGNYF